MKTILTLITTAFIATVSLPVAADEVNKVLATAYESGQSVMVDGLGYFQPPVLKMYDRRGGDNYLVVNLDKISDFRRIEISEKCSRKSMPCKIGISGDVEMENRVPVITGRAVFLQ